MRKIEAPYIGTQGSEILEGEAGGLRAVSKVRWSDYLAMSIVSGVALKTRHAIGDGLAGKETFDAIR